MSISSAEASDLLRLRLGTPINLVSRGPRKGLENQKILGFVTPNGRMLALDRESDHKTRIWFEPPAPPTLPGVSLQSLTPINANLGGKLNHLNKRRGLQVELDSEAALTRFLDWYGM
jgi:hypothetical protein